VQRKQIFFMFLAICTLQMRDGVVQTADALTIVYNWEIHVCESRTTATSLHVVAEGADDGRKAELTWRRDDTSDGDELELWDDSGIKATPRRAHSSACVTTAASTSLSTGGLSVNTPGIGRS
jgi:hypothetical protein